MRWWFQEKADADGWQLHEPLFRPVLVNDRRTREPVMRKMVNGRWVYRELTAAEASAFHAEIAW